MTNPRKSQETKQEENNIEPSIEKKNIQYILSWLSHNMPNQVGYVEINRSGFI